MIRFISLATLTLSLGLAGQALAEPDRDEALRVADEAAELLRYVEEEARFVAQAMIDTGDTTQWQRYNSYAFRAQIVAGQAEGYARDLANTMLPLRMIAQSFDQDRRDRTELGSQFSRLRRVPLHLEEAHREALGLLGELGALIAVAPPNPNDEPDVLGRHECTAHWSTGGAWMNFRGQGPSRNGAKAEALRLCRERVGPYCTISQCRRL